jgi:hypothetical protein
MVNDKKTVVSPVDQVNKERDISIEKSDMKKETSKLATVGLVVAVALVVLLGVSTGYALSVNKGGVSSSNSVSTPGSKSEKVIGELEEGVEYDEAEGKLVIGGIGGEGTHHLERDGGEDQYVYLTSSTVDLDVYIDQTVKVWGVTFAAQKAGWLMDVAKLEAK